MKKYNTTQLDPMSAAERGIIHRDMIAHAFRWSHVLNHSKIGDKILDVGCGSGNLYEVLYRNRYKPLRFTGVDIRKQTIEGNKKKFPNIEWICQDIVEDKLPKDDWNTITSFEVIEHISKHNANKFLENIKEVMTDKTVFMLSTPCFNGEAAKNHTYDGGDGRGKVPQEFTYQEIKDLLSSKFKIISHYGTFASVKDYKPFLTETEQKIYDKLHEYYESNVMSNIFAPLFPEHSRNVIWKCKL